jgi:hypothetical protein
LHLTNKCSRIKSGISQKHRVLPWRYNTNWINTLNGPPSLTPYQHDPTSFNIFHINRK